MEKKDSNKIRLDIRRSLAFKTPMPKVYVPDDDFVGQRVKITLCNYHEDTYPAPGYTREEVSMTSNCNCALKNKTVTITALKSTGRASFYHSTCYTIAESKNLIHETEFALESGGDEIFGYAFEDEKGNFLTSKYNYEPDDAYLFNTGIVKMLLKTHHEIKPPIKAWPLKWGYKSGITYCGDPVPWEKLKEIILVKG